MSGRFFTRARIVAAALPRMLLRGRPRGAPRRVLIAHHPKMMGDTLLMSTIAAKARHTWPHADIVMTASPATAPLFASRPWGIEAIPFDPSDASTLAAYRRRGGYDLAIVPGDNRYGWFARALGARWIVGFSGDRPRHKDLLLDEARAYPDKADVWQGTLALMVLKTIEAMGPLHGYGIARRIEQTSGNLLALNYGTLYPALLKLEQEGAIASEWGVSENNRKAKYYSLTSRGRQQLRAETATWKRYVAAISGVLETA